PDRAGYLADGPAWGDMAFLGYQRAQHDFEEARKCLALARPTAVVFHLMRVVEVGLQALATKLGLTLDLDQANWNTILNHLEKEGPKHPDWRGAPERYQGTVVHLRQVKTAFRNPCMHVPDRYTEEEAEELYGFVRAFMRNLAEIAPGEGVRF